MSEKLSQPDSENPQKDTEDELTPLQVEGAKQIERIEKTKEAYTEVNWRLRGMRYNPISKEEETKLAGSIFWGKDFAKPRLVLF